MIVKLICDLMYLLDRINVAPNIKITLTKNFVMEILLSNQIQILLKIFLNCKFHRVRLFKRDFDFRDPCVGLARAYCILYYSRF